MVYEETIKRSILDAVEKELNKITSRDLEKKIKGQFSVRRQDFQSALKSLVEERKLAYTYKYGRSFIEKSFSRPVKVGHQVILSPPGLHVELEGSEIEVIIQQGISFGGGDHPTTRLSIQGIEHVMRVLRISDIFPDTMILDIGTGSGVLGLAALKLGISQAIGTDNDPCAIAEARENARINSLLNRFRVTDQPAEEINMSFDLISANLRYPTLSRLSTYMAGHVRNKGAIVISGIRENEASELKRIFAGFNFDCIWEKSEKDWNALALTKSYQNS